MNTVCDYIRWFGDYSFEQIPLNGTDALIFCALSYFEITQEKRKEDLDVRRMLDLFEEGACSITIPDIGELYEKILQKKDTEAEAYWGLILCKYGIE